MWKINMFAAQDSQVVIEQVSVFLISAMRRKEPRIFLLSN